MTIYVIGAGVTGLTFARAARGAVVLEAGAAVGGKASSFKAESAAGTFVFDVGGHWFHRDSAPETLELLRGLPLLRHTRKAKVLIRGEWCDFPIQSSYRSLTDRLFVQAVEDELRHAPGRSAETPNYAELLLHSYGATLYDAFFRDYNRKMYGVEELSGMAVGRYDAVRNVPVDNNRGYNHDFYYPAGGEGAMAIPRHLAQGLPVLLESPVTRISLRDRTISVRGRMLRWDKLVSTMPLPSLIRIIGDADPEIVSLAGQLRASRGFVVNLGIKRSSESRYRDMDWAYFPDMAYPFYRVGFYSHVQPLLAPPGYEGMYAECSPLFFAGRQEAHSLIPSVVDKLIELGFIRSHSDIAVIKPLYLEHNYCLPQPRAVETILRYLRSYELFSIGRYGSWHWSSQHEDMRQALELAAELRGEATDLQGEAAAPGEGGR